MSTTIKLNGRIDAQRLVGKLNVVPSDGSSGGPLQAKTVYPSHSEQIIAPDEDYYGLVSVIVKPVPRKPACEVSVSSDAENVVENVVNIAVETEVSDRGIGLYIEDGWETIEQNCENGKAEELYALGDKKTITFTLDGVTESIDMEIIGFDHDDLVDGGKAKITFFSKQLLSTYRQMNSTNTNTGGWAGSYSLRSWCNGDLYNALPSDLQAVIKEVKKLSDGGQNSAALVETHDKVWLASLNEVGKTGQFETISGQGDNYSQISADSNWMIKEKVDGTVYYWWLRTSTTNDYKWIYVGKAGGVSYDNAANQFGVAFGFCI